MGGGGGIGVKTQKNSCKGKCQEKASCKEDGKEANLVFQKFKMFLGPYPRPSYIIIYK